MNCYEFFDTEYPPHTPDRHETVDDFGDETTSSNGERAARAAVAVPSMSDDPDESDISDLIADLLHFAHSKDCDVVRIVRCALGNFHAEAAELPDAEETTEPT